MGFSFWWILKVFSGLSLIFYTLGKTYYTETPIAWNKLFFFQCLILIGATVSLVHYQIFKKQKIRFSDPHQLVHSGGLFRWIRHPMYLGDFLIMAGFGGIANDKIGILFVILGWISLGIQCKIEDRLLGKQFGEAHQLWKSHTRLLFPGLF